jgi:hypothetical protein
MNLGQGTKGRRIQEWIELIARELRNEGLSQ